MLLLANFALLCPGNRNNSPYFHLYGSGSVCNQRKLPARRGDAGYRCGRAHCAQDELSTDQNFMRELTPAVLAKTLCTIQWKYFF